MRISDWSSDVCSSDLARAPGRFAAALSALGELGCTSLLEVGPGTTLSDLARPQIGATHMVSALGGGDEVASLLEALATLHAHGVARSEEHTSELQSLMRISYAVFCLKKKNKNTKRYQQMS